MTSRDSIRVDKIARILRNGILEAKTVGQASSIVVGIRNRQSELAYQYAGLLEEAQEKFVRLFWEDLKQTTLRGDWRRARSLFATAQLAWIAQPRMQDRMDHWIRFLEDVIQNANRLQDVPVWYILRLEDILGGDHRDSLIKRCKKQIKKIRAAAGGRDLGRFPRPEERNQSISERIPKRLRVLEDKRSPITSSWDWNPYQGDDQGFDRGIFSGSGEE